MRRGVPSPHRTSTTGGGLAIARFIPAPLADASLDRWDLLHLCTLFLLWFCLLVLRNDSLPLQIWDESRLANNALEMIRSGHWLVPSYWCSRSLVRQAPSADLASGGVDMARIAAAVGDTPADDARRLGNRGHGVGGL